MTLKHKLANRPSWSRVLEKKYTCVRVDIDDFHGYATRLDIIKVKKWFQSDLGTYNKISNIIGKAELVYDSIAISTYEEEDKDANVVCAKAADELLTISNITASFVLGKLGDKICISGRSIGDINVQVILEKLGGGGHITLAGAQVEGMDMEETKQELLNRIHEYFSEQI